ncbi:MAG TPA: galactosyltransferase-related protein [Polyangiaceae bacterium]|nr:galactosyltransferase-related protein [Polyangiaceae bacterium]
MAPRLSVIVPWANRPELSRTLAGNQGEFLAAGAEVIVANCGGDRELLARCVAEAGMALSVVHIDTSFNKALALNLGVTQASAPTLLFLDCDVELGRGSCTTALSLVSAACAVTLDRVVESSPGENVAYPYLSAVIHTTELEMADGRRVRIETNRRRLNEGCRSAPGIVFVDREQFIEVDGMNSDLTGWGWEDLDLLVRLQLQAGVRIERAGSATHLTHGDDRRCIDGVNRAGNEAWNAAMCLANYGLGHYYGTYGSDCERWAVAIEQRAELGRNARLRGLE